MPEELDKLVENLSEPSAWIRVLFMLGFAVGFYLVLVPLIGLIALVQALFTVIGGEPNDNLRRFGEGLTLYVTEILQFLFYNRQEKPFPFSGFPMGDGDDDLAGDHPIAPEAAASSRPVPKAPAKKAAAKTATAKTTTAKKTAAKKTAAKKSPAKKSAGKKQGDSGKPASAAAAAETSASATSTTGTTASGSGATTGAVGDAPGTAGQAGPAPADK